jgi:4-amino-4-deoxy-L-arabinose transferase-like glycosyltransferase
MNALRQNRPLVLAAAAFTILWFALLAGRPLYDPDEGRYAEIPREMAAGGDWVTPHLNGLTYLEKPPLQYWITALLFRAFGETAAVARLWTGLCGYMSLLIVFFIGRRLWGAAAGRKALLLTAASTLFVLLGHQLTLDMALSFFLLACLACFIAAQLRRGDRRACTAWMLGCWTAMACAVLTKGLIGVLIPAATLIVYVAWQRDYTALRNLSVRWGLPLFALITVPWFYAAARDNADFLQFFFIREHFARFLTPIEHRTQPWWFFIPVLAAGVLPWLPEAARVLGLGWRTAAPRGEFSATRLLWIWSVFVLVFFSVSDSKLIPYILPAVPTLALLCAEPRAGDGARGLWGGVLLTLAAAAGILAYASTAWSSANGLALALCLRTVLMWTVAALCVSALGSGVLLRRHRAPDALASLCAGWFVASVTILIGAAQAQGFYSARDPALALRAVAPPEAPVFSVQCYDQSLPFYLKRGVVLVDYRDEFDFGLRHEPGRGIASLAEFSARWSALDSGYAVMPPATRDRLSVAGVPMRELARFGQRVLISRR